MPYSIKKNGRRYCVYLKNSGKKVGCHDSKAQAQAQIAAIESQKHSARHLLSNQTPVVAEIRTDVFDGVTYTVVPIVAMVEGVIWPINAPNPEFVPAETLAAVPGGWNGRPVFASLGHPTNAEGQPVTGNTPRTLEGAIGLVFNARTDGRRLLMEAWINPEKPGAKEVLDRVNSGRIVEISVGAFVIAENSKGTFGGKQYDGIWREVVPDHLALLPEGDEGACSVAMGCGIRSARRVHLITNDGVQFQTEGTVDPEKIFAELMKESLKDDAFKEIHSFGDGVAIYETAAGKMYRQGYEVSADGQTVKLGEGRLEVEPIVYYEPVDIKAAKGARHSASDMLKIQGMHDYSMELGAQCAPKAMAAKPCGCQHTKESDTMKRTKEEREALVKSLRSKTKPEVIAKLDAAAKNGGGDIIDAIVAQIKEKLGLSDEAASAIADLPESVLVELAGLTPAAPADPAKPADGSTPPPTASTAKPKTEAEYLAEAPQAIRDLVADARAKDEARKTELITVLKGAQQEYTEADMQKMSVKELERLGRACKANVAKPVDFGVNGPRAAEGEAQAAPAPIDYNARLKASRGVK